MLFCSAHRSTCLARMPIAQPRIPRPSAGARPSSAAGFPQNPPRPWLGSDPAGFRTGTPRLKLGPLAVHVFLILDFLWPLLVFLPLLFGQLAAVGDLVSSRLVRGSSRLLHLRFSLSLWLFVNRGLLFVFSWFSWVVSKLVFGCGAFGIGCWWGWWNWWRGEKKEDVFD